MKKLVCLITLLLCSWAALAQRHNPKYDEWLRNQAATTGNNSSLPLRNNSYTYSPKQFESKPFDVYVAVGALSTNGNMTASVGGGSDHVVDAVGLGPSLVLGLGDLYAPLTDKEEYRVCFGGFLKWGNTYGTGSSSKAASASLFNTNAVQGSRGYEFSTTTYFFTLNPSLGVKFRVGNDMTVLLAGGVGAGIVDIRAHEQYISYTYFPDGFMVKRSYQGGYNHLGIQAEFALLFNKYMYASIMAERSVSLGDPRSINAVRLNIGGRLPLVY